MSKFERDLKIVRRNRQNEKRKEIIKSVFSITPKETEILIKEFKDISSASRALGISTTRLQNTMRETPYNEYETCLDFFNRHCGIHKPHYNTSELFKEEQLNRIFEGTMVCEPKNRNKLLYSLLHFGYKKRECECCNTCPPLRTMDNTYPFILTFKDMKKNKDFSLENLQIVCYNCSYTKMSDYAFTMGGVKKFRKAGIKLIEKLDTQWEAINYNLDTKKLTEMEVDYKNQWDYGKSQGIKQDENVKNLLNKFAKLKDS